MIENYNVWRLLFSMLFLFSSFFTTLLIFLYFEVSEQYSPPLFSSMLYYNYGNVSKKWVTLNDFHIFGNFPVFWNHASLWSSNYWRFLRLYGAAVWKQLENFMQLPKCTKFTCKPLVANLAALAFRFAS